MKVRISVRLYIIANRGLWCTKAAYQYSIYFRNSGLLHWDFLGTHISETSPQYKQLFNHWFNLPSSKVNVAQHFIGHPIQSKGVVIFTFSFLFLCTSTKPKKGCPQKSGQATCSILYLNDVIIEFLREILYSERFFFCKRWAQFPLQTKLWWTLDRQIKST